MFSVVFLWFALAVIVGVAGNTRGRSGIGWFFLAVLISPLIAGLLVLALPRVSAADVGEIKISRQQPGLIEAAPAAPFEPEGIYAGIPYRVAQAGAIEAMMHGGMVRFRDMDQFLAAADGKTLR